MKRCVLCKGTSLRRSEHKDSLEVAGRTFEQTVPCLKCENCGEIFFLGQDLQQLELQAAASLASNGPCCGESFRFMRKAIGLKANELAGLLAVTAETVSRWENQKRDVDRAAWLTVGSLVLDRIAGVDTTMRRLRALDCPEQTSRPSRKAME